MRATDPSPLVVVFDGEWLYAMGYLGSYALPVADDRPTRRLVLRAENAEVTGRGGSDYPLAVLPSRVTTREG